MVRVNVVASLAFFLESLGRGNFSLKSSFGISVGDTIGVGATATTEKAIPMGGVGEMLGTPALAPLKEAQKRVRYPVLRWNGCSRVLLLLLL